MRCILICIGFCLIQLNTQAQTTFVHRVDGGRGITSSFTAALMFPKEELWCFDYRGVQDWEYGRQCTVFRRNGHTISLGGYAVIWAKTGNLFALPWLTYQGKFGQTKLVINLASYLPLNGGPRITFSDEMSLVQPVTKRLDVGLAASFWEQAGAQVPLRLGPAIKTQLSSSINLSARALILGRGGSNSFRLELSTTF